MVVVAGILHYLGVVSLPTKSCGNYAEKMIDVDFDLVVLKRVKKGIQIYNLFANPRSETCKIKDLFVCCCGGG